MNEYQNYDSEAINEIADSINIKEYLDSIGLEPQKRSGSNLYYHCCVNSDKTPSLCVSTENNMYHCFSCGSGSNVLAYMVKEQGLSYQDACKKILEISGKESKPIIVPNSMKFFNNVKRTKLKYSGDKEFDHTYIDYSEYEKYPKEYPQEWLDEGITKEAMDAFDIRVDTKSNRIIYALYTPDNRICGIKGRTRFKEWKELGLPKYISTKLGGVDFLCGLKENKENIIARDEVIITEGIKSVMKLWGWGVKNAVSSETANLNEKQIQLLLKLKVSSVVIAYDKDKDIRYIKEHIGMLPRFCNVYAVIDNKGLLNNKDSPCDRGQQVWNELYQNRWRIG